MRTSPYAPFSGSTSAIGLHVRRWWLEDSSVSLRAAERRTTGRILARKRRDGSLGGLAATISGLFALHLLQRDRSLETDRALDWLWESGLTPLPMSRRTDGAVYHDLPLRVKRGEAARLDRANETPFVKGCSGFIKTAAAIVLASSFGRGREARVLRALLCLDSVGAARGGLWCTPSCSANLLRAYATHPDASRGRAMARAVKALGRVQNAHGSWPGIPFAPTFEALTHLDSREAKAQVKCAIRVVERTQNRDGTWGHAPNREVTSYLVVKGIRNLEA